MLFPFRCLKLEKSKVKKCLSRTDNSAAEMVLTLELKLERDKTGDVGKFHGTYKIHISKFMFARDHTLKFPIHFRYKDRLADGQLFVV